MSARGVIAGTLVALAAACAKWDPQPLPVPVSPEPAGGTEFKAGFARVDLTPPPGVGLAGSGPEGRRSTGYRTRLYASAMVLEDAGGERIAFVVVDLTHVSANIHRLAAERLVHTVGIGADRLIVSATHTHSGPAHFYGERQYNENASRVAGYDPRITDLIVSRVADAVSEAATHLRSAVVGYRRIQVDGVSWNRSLKPHCENRESAAHCESGDKGPTVDRSLFMLRVDEVVGGRHVPMGSFSVFPLHPTALPSLNTLLDGDTHVRIMNAMSDRTQARYGRPAVHLFANGAEGDVAPDIKREQCDIPVPGVFDPVPMPRGPGELVDFLETDAARVRHCVTHGVGEAQRIADRVSDRAFELYVGLEDALSAPRAIRRSFTTDSLPNHGGLCEAPEAGSATAAGADSVITRIRGWRWLLPFVPLGLEEGGKAVKRRADCQRPKRTLLGPIQTLLVVGEHGLPKNAQITTVRLDSLLLGAVPAEVTTVAGLRMRRSMAEGFGGPGGRHGADRIGERIPPIRHHRGGIPAPALRGRLHALRSRHRRVSRPPPGRADPHDRDGHRSLSTRLRRPDHRVSRRFRRDRALTSRRGQRRRSCRDDHGRVRRSGVHGRMGRSPTGPDLPTRFDVLGGAAKSPRERHDRSRQGRRRPPRDQCGQATREEPLLVAGMVARSADW